MTLLGIDLGGTKLASAIFSTEGIIMSGDSVLLDGRTGSKVGELVTNQIRYMMDVARRQGLSIGAIGVSVPGISIRESGTIWAPNIP